MTPVALFVTVFTIAALLVSYPILAATVARFGRRLRHPRRRTSEVVGGGS